MTTKRSPAGLWKAIEDAAPLVERVDDGLDGVLDGDLLDRPGHLEPAAAPAERGARGALRRRRVVARHRHLGAEPGQQQAPRR